MQQEQKNHQTEIICKSNIDHRDPGFTAVLSRRIAVDRMGKRIGQHHQHCYDDGYNDPQTEDWADLTPFPDRTEQIQKQQDQHQYMCDKIDITEEIAGRDQKRRLKIP